VTKRKPPTTDGVLDALKAGVAECIAPEDVPTHFDLGCAYADMGLLDDAIHELELVLRVQPKHVEARAKLAQVLARRADHGDEDA
jgi:hypothetical protein